MDSADTVAEKVVLSEFLKNPDARPLIFEVVPPQEEGANVTNEARTIGRNIRGHAPFVHCLWVPDYIEEEGLMKAPRVHARDFADGMKVENDLYQDLVITQSVARMPKDEFIKFLLSLGSTSPDGYRNLGLIGRDNDVDDFPGFDIPEAGAIIRNMNAAGETNILPIGIAMDCRPGEEGRVLQKIEAGISTYQVQLSYDMDRVRAFLERLDNACNEGRYNPWLFLTVSPVNNKISRKVAEGAMRHPIDRGYWRYINTDDSGVFDEKSSTGRNNRVLKRTVNDLSSVVEFGYGHLRNVRLGVIVEYLTDGMEGLSYRLLTKLPEVWEEIAHSYGRV